MPLDEEKVTFQFMQLLAEAFQRKNPKSVYGSGTTNVLIVSA